MSPYFTEEISTIIQFATLLEEFKFLLREQFLALKDGIVALYPYDSHLPGLEDTQ